MHSMMQYAVHGEALVIFGYPEFIMSSSGDSNRIAHPSELEGQESFVFTTGKVKRELLFMTGRRRQGSVWLCCKKRKFL